MNGRNERLGSKLIDKVERFKYLRLVVYENGRIAEDVASRIRRGWKKWREAATRVLYDKKKFH